MARRFVIKPNGWWCKLSECAPGPFVYHQTLCFKTEYKDKNNDGTYSIVAYNEAGEYFSAGDDPLVQPVAAEWEEYDGEE